MTNPAIQGEVNNQVAAGREVLRVIIYSVQLKKWPNTWNEIT